MASFLSEKAQDSEEESRSLFVREWQQRLGREVEQGSERYGDDRANKAYDVVGHTEIWCRK